MILCSNDGSSQDTELIEHSNRRFAYQTVNIPVKYTRRVSVSDVSGESASGTVGDA